MFGIEKDFQKLMEQVYGPLNKNKMTNFQPKPQHPEEVANGIRDAFRQAIKDGVMDATPYLKQMTFKSDIEKTEAEIKVLQKKLELLKEIETHKSQPRMYLENSGKYEVVSYNGENYYRLEYPTDKHESPGLPKTRKTCKFYLMTDQKLLRLIRLCHRWYSRLGPPILHRDLLPNSPLCRF